MSGEERPGMLLSILQCEESPTAKNYPAPNVNSAEMRNPNQREP